MSTKYKIGMSKMEGKSDFDLRVDPQRYHARVNQGQLPIVTIHEDKFFVDLRLHELRLTTDPFKKIALPENFIANKGSYEFYYSLRTQEAVEINPNMTKLPGKVFKVTVPPARKLDPVAVARIERKEIKDYLMKCPFEKEVTAKVIPLSETELKQRAKLNKEASKKKEEDSLLKKNRGNNHRGKHL
jgi:hypothetical protein